VNPHHVPDASERAAVDAVGQHTASGSGGSQREPWPANVEPSGDPALR
jgi:hypothetical protein